MSDSEHGIDKWEKLYIVVEPAFEDEDYDAYEEMKHTIVAQQTFHIYFLITKSLLDYYGVVQLFIFVWDKVNINGREFPQEEQWICGLP